jgi:carboxyl-terminal processing protease
MEKKKSLRFVLFAMVGLVLVLCTFGGGVATGYFLPTRDANPTQETASPTPAITEGTTADTGTPADLAVLFRPFWEAWDIVHSQYVDQPVDDTLLLQGAIRGMLESLGDPHTLYMDPQVTEDENAILSGEYEGIGAWVDTGEEFLTIISPMTDSPAEKAGLLPGDKIVAVDGQDMAGTDPAAVRLKVLGPEGSMVVLTIVREGLEEPFDVSITRNKITVPSVESEMLEGNIAYVKLTIFGEDTASNLHAQLQTLMTQNPEGIILDLRNNGGGLVTAAVSVASEFMNEGAILYEKYGDGSLVDYPAEPNGLAIGVPLVVLVNEGTASASEIVAGAIQDYGLGKLIGVTTYGKGSMQYWVPISDGGTVRVTVAKWLTPNKRTIDKIGLTPDMVVERTIEDMTANLDPQLDAAVQVLLNP